jgi:hypothetical protein
MPKCRQCGMEFAQNNGADGLIAHRRIHKKQIKTAPLDIIHEHERAIQKELLNLESERDNLQARILEIDNICAKYRKLK